MFIHFINILAFICLLIAQPSLLSADAAVVVESDKLQPQELFAAQHMGQVIDSLRSTSADSIWPGFRLQEPAILTFQTGHLLAFHLKSSDPLWRTVSVNGHIAAFSPSDKWGAMQSSLNQAFPIENQSAYVFAFDAFGRDPFLPFLIFVHERFHHHQFANFAAEHTGPAGLKLHAQADYDDYLNSDNLALLKMEEALLADFLSALKAPQEKDARAALLKRFVAINRLRTALLAPSSQKWERLQQQMEGLADYVGIKLLDAYPVLADFDAIAHMQRLMENYLGDRRVVECAIQWRHYGIGAVLGYALDDLAVPAWKMDVERRGKAPSELLAEALPLTAEEVQQLAAAVKRDYGYEKIRGLLEKQVSQYRQEITTWQQKYRDMEGVVVALGKPQGKPVNGGGSVAHTFKLGDGVSLSLQCSSVLTVADSSWKLSFERIPLLFESRTDGHEFKVEPSLTLVIDGAHISLASFMQENGEKTFRSLAWTGESSAFTAEDHSGTISAKAGQLSIVFD